MKVKDNKTGNILESNNELVCAQWKTYSERYAEIQATKPATEDKGKPAKK